jgi:excinuclease ABC subunit C
VTLIALNVAAQNLFDPKSFLSQLTTQPGVYRMYGARDELLYVGKARNLKKRVGSYFLRASGDPRIESMVSQIARMEVTLTASEDEALLLEATLIKELTPRYNIMYRDDKSYPLVRITQSHPYPRIGFYRGAKSGPDLYFGPFPSAGSVRETLVTLQKLFRLRPCTDIFFANRQRPCLQHQIRRCSAPCVNLISTEDYVRDIKKAVRLLEGKGDDLARELSAEMEQAAEALDFERAARLRDQIAALQRVRENRSFTGGADELDVIVAAPHASSSCIVVVSVRDGINFGHGSFFPRHPPNVEMGELLAGFIAQYYLDRPIPPEILVSHTPDECEWLAHSLAARAGRKVRISEPQRGSKVKLLTMATSTAAQSLSTRLVESASMDQRLLELQQALDLERPPQRLECFDISHTGGEKAVASCVVFDGEGPLKSGYRRFNIEGITPGDDYDQAGRASALCAHQERRNAGAGRVVHRRRQRPAGRRTRSTGRNRISESARGGHRQRANPQARSRTADSAGTRAALDAAAGLSRAAFDPAHPRRSAPVCDHRPSCAARQGAADFKSRSDRRARPDAAKGAA